MLGLREVIERLHLKWNYLIPSLRLTNRMMSLNRLEELLKGHFALLLQITTGLEQRGKWKHLGVPSFTGS
jgi:hypothetical protein